MVQCVIFFGCPARGEKKDIPPRYDSRFAAIVSYAEALFKHIVHIASFALTYSLSF